jgi:hypothetical protein
MDMYVEYKFSDFNKHLYRNRFQSHLRTCAVCLQINVQPTTASMEAHVTATSSAVTIFHIPAVLDGGLVERQGCPIDLEATDTTLHRHR